MSITSIGRYFVGNPNIVAIVTDDDLAEITTAGYLTSDAILADIRALNNGDFQWKDTDMVLISYAPDFLVNWFQYDSVNATFVANPTAGGGSLYLQKANNLSDVADPAVSANNLGFLANLASKYPFVGFSTPPDVISALKWYEVALDAVDLATGGTILIVGGSNFTQYRVRDVRINYSASGLSGGGGNRLVQITDGTTVYNNAGITAALLGTPVNTMWGGSGNPLPAATVALNALTQNNAELVAKYAGGTTDYTTGIVNISVLVEQVG